MNLGNQKALVLAGMFFQIVKGTEIGIFMKEKEKNILDVSFRARGNLDVSKIAAELGGEGIEKLLVRR